MPTTNQQILEYLQENFEDGIIAAMCSDIQEIKVSQAKMIVELRRNRRDIEEAGFRINNIDQETTIALLKAKVEGHGTNWGKISGILLGIIQAIIVTLLIARLIP